MPRLDGRVEEGVTAALQFQPNSCCCGTTGEHTSLFVARDFNFGATNEHSVILRCVHCDSIFPALFPTAASVGEAYRSYYTAPTVVRRWSLLKALINISRRDYLARSLPRSDVRLLDFGCGSGEYLHQIRARHPSASCFGTDVTHPGKGAEGFEWIPLDRLDESRRFDWITASHVLEHLPDPIAALRSLTRQLTDGGGMWLSTPNAQSFLIATFGPWARDIDFPRHRQVFSRRLLTDSLERAGLTVSSRDPPRLNAILNFASSARNLVHDGQLGVSAKAWLLSKGAVRLAVHLMKPAAWRMAEAPELVVVARRRGT